MCCDNEHLKVLFNLTLSKDLSQERKENDNKQSIVLEKTTDNNLKILTDFSDISSAVKFLKPFSIYSSIKQSVKVKRQKRKQQREVYKKKKEVRKKIGPKVQNDCSFFLLKPSSPSPSVDSGVDISADSLVSMFNIPHNNAFSLSKNNSKFTGEISDVESGVDMNENILENKFPEIEHYPMAEDYLGETEDLIKISCPAFCHKHQPIHNDCDVLIKVKTNNELTKLLPIEKVEQGVSLAEEELIFIPRPEKFFKLLPEDYDFKKKLIVDDISVGNEFLIILEADLSTVLKCTENQTNSLKENIGVIFSDNFENVHNELSDILLDIIVPLETFEIKRKETSEVNDEFTESLVNLVTIEPDLESNNTEDNIKPVISPKSYPAFTVLTDNCPISKQSQHNALPDNNECMMDNSYSNPSSNASYINSPSIETTSPYVVPIPLCDGIAIRSCHFIVDNDDIIPEGLQVLLTDNGNCTRNVSSENVFRDDAENILVQMNHKQNNDGKNFDKSMSDIYMDDNSKNITQCLSSNQSLLSKAVQHEQLQGLKEYKFNIALLQSISSGILKKEQLQGGSYSNTFETKQEIPNSKNLIDHQSMLLNRFQKYRLQSNRSKMLRAKKSIKISKRFTKKKMYNVDVRRKINSKQNKKPIKSSIDLSYCSEQHEKQLKQLSVPLVTAIDCQATNGNTDCYEVNNDINLNPLPKDPCESDEMELCDISATVVLKDECVVPVDDCMMKMNTTKTAVVVVDNIQVKYATHNT